MAEYKAQHWLPAGYMKYFAAGEMKGRKTKIYYTNKDASLSDRTVAALSYKNYHYSHADAEGAETSFHAMENEYPVLIEKILSGADLNTREYYSLILTMVDFHARNPSYENLTVEENYQAFLRVSRGLLTEIFSGCDGYPTDLQTMMDFFSATWEMQPLTSPKEELFSSDHPSLVFSIGGRLAFILLPITPHHALVAVDTRVVEITGNRITDDDNGMLNAYQAMVCIDYVYSDVDLTRFLGDEGPLTKWLNKPKSRGFVKADQWLPEFNEYPAKMPSEFSFLRII